MRRRMRSLEDVQISDMGFKAAKSREFLSNNPSLKFIFETSAMGSLRAIPQTENERALLGNMVFTSRPPSVVFDGGFETLKFYAIEMGRTVSSYKKDDKYFVEFSPIRN